MAWPWEQFNRLTVGRRKVLGLIRPLVVVGLVTSILSSCGSDRSPESFCRVYEEEKAQFLSKYDERATETDALSSQDEFAGMLLALSSGFESIGDATIIFEKLDAVAPEDIQPDVAAVRDYFKSITPDAAEAAKNPLEAIPGGLAKAFVVSGSFERVGAYVTENCNE